MDRIETKEDFREWARVVNFTQNVDQRNKLQDVFGHSSADLLKKLFLEMESDWRLLLFCIMKNQGEDMALNFIRYIALAWTDKWINEHDAIRSKEWDKLYAEQARWKECKKPLYKRLKEYRELVEQFKRRYQEMYGKAVQRQKTIEERNLEISELKNKVYTLQEKLGAYEGISEWIKKTVKIITQEG